MANVSTEKKAAEKLKEHTQNNPYAERIEQLSAGVLSTPSLTEGKTRPTNNNRYAERLEQAVDAATSHPEFSYDAKADPAYQAYAKAYKREGDRATQDALGKAAAVNGGALSTAGVQAGAQAGQYYAAQLADKIPTLYADAYARHLDEYKKKLNNVDILGQQEATDYDRYRTEVSDWERAEATDYERRLKALDIQRTLENDTYSRLTDDYLREKDEDATAYNRTLDEKNEALTMWQQQGYASKEVAEILGIPEGTPTNSQKYADTQKTSTPSVTESDENAYTIPSIYAGVFERAKKANDGSESGKEAALEAMYNLAQADETRHRLSDDMFEIMLLEVGITADEYIAYMKAKEGPQTITVSKDWQGPPAPGQNYVYN